jgi:O-antigen/teichoic acid export membrane protein
MTGSPAPSAFRQVRNVLANWGAFVLSASAGLFLSPFVVDRLGADVFGLWTIVGSLTSSLGIFDLGMRSAVVRFISREHARGDHEAASRRAAQLRALFGVASVLAVLSGAVLIAGLPRFFTVPDRLVGPGRLALTLSVLSLAVTLNGSVSTGVLMAMERLDVLGFTDIVFEACRIALVLLVLGNGGGIVGLAAVGFTLGLLRFGVVLQASRRIYPELGRGVALPSWQDARSILDVSLFSTLIYTSVTLASQAGTLIIGASLPLAVAAYYAIGATLPEYAGALNRPIAQTVHPRASRLDAVGDAEGLRQLILTTGKYSALVLLPVLLTFLLRGKSFVGLWQGPEFRTPSGGVLGILAIGILFAGPRHVIQAAFVGSGLHRVLSPWYIAEAVVRIGATLVLVRTIGLNGPAWATIVPGIVLSVGLLPALCRRYFGLSRRAMVQQIWLRPLLAMVPFAAALVAIERWWPAAGYLLFFSQVALALPLAALGGLYIGLGAGERQALLVPLQARVRQRFRRAPTS